MEHNLYDELVNKLKIEARLPESIASSIALTMPKDLNQLYCIPRIGRFCLQTKGNLIIEIIKNFISVNKLNYLSIDECKSIYSFFCEKISLIKTKHFIETFEFCEYVNEQLINSKIDFKLNNKMILYVLHNLKILDYNDQTHDYITNSYGLSYGFDGEIKYSYKDNSSYFKLCIKSTNCWDFLTKHIFDAFYIFYGKNPLNALNLQMPSYSQIDHLDNKNILVDKQNSKYKDNEYLFIFNLNGAVYDSIYKMNSNYIKGFENIFVNPKYPDFKAYNNYCILINKSKRIFELDLVVKHENYINKDNCYFLNDKEANIKKLEHLINLKRGKYKKIIGFGADEKDAYVFSNLNIDYYLVNKNYGYDNIETLKSKIVKNSPNCFRKHFMYDKIFAKRFENNNFKSNYFHDIIVYYKRYYDKTNNINPNCLFMEGKDHYDTLTHNSYGENSETKSLYIKAHINDFIYNDFKDLNYDNNVIFAKVPGHDEKYVNFDSPISILFKELKKLHPDMHIYHNLLLRNNVVSQNHGSKDSYRGIDKHLNSIDVIDDNRIKGKTIYLFDDIVTSGASMMACTELLYKHGANHVVCFCLARTCPKLGYPLFEIEGERK